MIINMDGRIILSMILAGLQFFLINSDKISSKATFELVSNESQGPMININDRSFHQCSMTSENCNFVVKNTETNKYTRYNNEADIPRGTKNLVIFKKVKRAFLSCKNALNEGYTESGIHYLLRNDGSTYEAYCDQETDGGGWTMLQRRVDTKLSFRKNWKEYEHGFGNLSGSFWLGLKAMHELTTREQVSFRVDLKDASGKAYKVINNRIIIANVDNGYRLHVSGYDKANSDLEQRFNFIQSMEFSTYDEDNDNDAGNCANSYDGGWWYRGGVATSCAYVKLNDKSGPTWNNKVFMSYSSMMIR